MRICPDCRNVSLDVTGRLNPEYRCWDCGKTFKNLDAVFKMCKENHIAPELRLYMSAIDGKAQMNFCCPLCEVSAKNPVRFVADDVIVDRYIQHLRIGHDFVADVSTVTTNMGGLKEFDLKELNKIVDKKVKS
jgi:hypothetical protein